MITLSELSIYAENSTENCASSSVLPTLPLFVNSERRDCGHNNHIFPCFQIEPIMDWENRSHNVVPATPWSDGMEVGMPIGWLSHPESQDAGIERTRTDFKLEADSTPGMGTGPTFLTPCRPTWTGSCAETSPTATFRSFQKFPEYARLRLRWNL